VARAPRNRGELPPYEKSATTRGFVLRELALWAAVYPLYLAVRGWSIADPRLAFADAWRVIGWERPPHLSRGERAGVPGAAARRLLDLLH